MNVLEDRVLVLNKHWLAVNITTVEEAIKQMVVGAAVGMNIVNDDEYYPVNWDEWLKLDVRETDRCVHSPKLTVRAPEVIIASKYDKIPTSSPKLSASNIKKLYRSVCQYTGEYAPDGNVDHVIPKDKGGTNTWENMVWSKKSINSKKGNRYNHEVGLPDIKGKKPPISRVPLKILHNMNPKWRIFVGV